MNAPEPDPEDWAAWCEHPVTRWLAARLVTAAEAQRTAWVKSSWELGKADPNMLIELRVRADAYSSFVRCNRSDYIDFDTTAKG